MIGKVLWVAIGMLAAGCTPSYEVTEEMAAGLAPGVCRIGEIVYDEDRVYTTTARLTDEEIGRLREHLETALEGTRLFTSVTMYDDGEDYEVRGVIREVVDGSGRMSFPGFAQTGSVQFTVYLELRNKEEVLFAGNFRQRVSSPYGGLEVVFERIAWDFADALEERGAGQQRSD